MGVFDNFANRFRSDDDYEDEDLDDYEDEEYEDQSRGRGLFGGRKQQSYEEEEEEVPRSRTSIKGNARSGNSGSVQTMPARSTRSGVPSAPSKMQVRIIKPSSFDQARQIADTLLAHRTVLLNLEGLDVNTAQRIVDFASGSCYALRGNFMKISRFIIVITPEDVDIAGDIAAAGGQEAVAGAFAAGAATAASRGGNVGAGTMQADAGNPFMSGMNGGF